MDTSPLGPHGALSRQDAIARFGPQEVRRMQESARWRAPWPGVLVDEDRLADPLTRACAALVFAGPNAVLGGRTAAYVHGCRSVEPLPVHLVVPYGHWLRTRPGLEVHNARFIDPDREVRDGLAVFNLERVLTDMLCRARPTDALALADEVLAMVDPGGREAYRKLIAQRLERRRDPRGTRRGARILAVATGRAESPAESWFLWRIVDCGFPVPEVNWSLRGPDGREVRRLDYAWPQLRIAVEYNGYAVHADRTAEDAARNDDLRRRGWIVIVVEAEDLASPGRFEAALTRAFRERGADVSGRARGALRGLRHRDPDERRVRAAG
ncbi:MAG TPA: hypothetical protein VKZ81_34995 [Pseudonocardia sp.]|uniref:hypothetical protein n=1 Tax=Pseudonocardia sp. TaxID=60912 RepID=UPI002B4B1516|nr:hypothetical protein [Pseudonocardia sp.]HLU60700.1 hypothetical protein [Pseudonocardia sp.]